MANPTEMITWYSMMSLILPVKYYFSVYIGQLAVIALIFGIVTRRIRLNALLLMTLLSGWFLIVGMDGSYSFLHKIGNMVLPMMKKTRNEWMYWNYPLTFAILYAAGHIESFMRSEGSRQKAVAVLIYVALLVIVFVSAYDMQIHLEAFAVHLIIAFFWLGAALMIRWTDVQKLFVVGIISLEFFMVFNRVSVDTPVKRHGDSMDTVLTHQISASMSFRDGELVRQTMPMRVLRDENRPTISDSRMNPYLISGLNENFVDNMNQKRFTGWWYNTQERTNFVAIKESPLLEQLEGAPLYVLFNKETGQQSGPVRFDAISCSSFDFSVKSDDPKNVFLLNQMYDDRWNVSVDGLRQPLLHANQFFMGVQVGAGMHAIQFQFRDRVFTLSLAITGMTLVSIVIYMIIRKRSKTKLRDGTIAS